MLRVLVPSLLLALSLAGCQSSSRSRITPVPPRTIEGIASRYQPMFAALRGAVIEHEDAVARRIASNLRARLSADAARDEDARVQDAQALLEGFDRILKGRALIETLDLELRVRALEGQPAVQVLLAARTKSRSRLELRTGGATLRIHRISLTPEGKESRAVRRTAVGNLASLVLDEGWLEVPLAIYATTIPSNCLAARTHWTLDLLAGEILEEGRPYPAQDVHVSGEERVDLAAFLPNSVVEPAHLAAYVCRPEVALAPILERTVRIAPEHREEALDLLTPMTVSMVDEQLAKLVPTYRWLSRTNAPGRDPRAWKAWLEHRAEVRAQQGSR